MGGLSFTKFIMYIILLITFLGLINIVFSLHRFAFYVEFLILLGLILIAIISVVGINNDFRWAWILLKVFFIFVAIDMILIYLLSTAKIPYFTLLLAVAIVGFFISFFSIKKQKVPVEEVKKTFKPGKYIASKTGAKFHAPKCDWAKKVKKRNAVWFDSKEEAKKAGYKADSCVK